MARTPEQKAARKIYEAERWAKNGDALRAIARERGKKFREDNAERLRIYKREWKLANPEKMKESRSKYKKAHPRTENDKLRRKAPENLEKSRRYSLRWNNENAERLRETKKVYEARADVKERIHEKYVKDKAADPEKFRLRAKISNVKNKLQNALRQRLRDARKLQAGGTVSKKEVLDLWVKQNGKCVFFLSCGNLLTEGKRREWHVDHIDPLRPRDKERKAGRNSIENIQILCATCNTRKNNIDPYKFAQANGMLFCDITHVR